MPVAKIRKGQLKFTYQDLVSINDQSGGTRNVDYGSSGLRETSGNIYKHIINGEFRIGDTADRFKFVGSALQWNNNGTWVEMVKDVQAGTAITVSRSGGIITVSGAYVAGTGITITGATISVTSPPVPLTGQQNTFTAKQIFQGGIELPSNAARGVSDGWFSKTNLNPQYTRSNPTRYCTFNGNSSNPQGLLFKIQGVTNFFGFSDNAVVFLNGQMLQPGSISGGNWQYGDFVWENFGSINPNYPWALSFREPLESGDWLFIIGWFDWYEYQ